MGTALSTCDMGVRWASIDELAWSFCAGTACSARSSAAKRGLFEHGAFPGSTPQPGSDLAFACPLFNGIAPGEYFYFTHSFIAPTGSHTIAETTHSTRFTSAVQFGECAFGVQFHPEKSSDAGARVLANFVAIAARG